MGFIQDNTCERGDVEGVMDLTEIEDTLNEQQATIEQLKSELNDCTFILCSVFGEMNYLNYKSDPVILKKYEKLFGEKYG